MDIFCLDGYDCRALLVFPPLSSSPSLLLGFPWELLCLWTAPQLPAAALKLPQENADCPVLLSLPWRLTSTEQTAQHPSSRNIMPLIALLLELSPFTILLYWIHLDSVFSHSVAICSYAACSSTCSKTERRSVTIWIFKKFFAQSKIFWFVKDMFCWWPMFSLLKITWICRKLK